MVTIFPGMIFMYRPDVFEAYPAFRDLLVFPMNLVWYPDLPEFFEERYEAIQPHSQWKCTLLHIGAAQSQSDSYWSQRFLSCWLGGSSNGRMCSENRLN